jgi:hypothetical protein
METYKVLIKDRLEICKVNGKPFLRIEGDYDKFQEWKKIWLSENKGRTFENIFKSSEEEYMAILNNLKDYILSH